MATMPDEWRSWLALRMVRGVGPVVYQNLLRAFGEPRQALAANPDALGLAGIRPEVARAIRGFRDWAAVDEQMARMRSCTASLLTWNDPSYPAGLRNIHDPPPFLFILGDAQPRDRLAVAVVGSRNVSAYGLRMTRLLAEGLVEYGITVVSGLARGTDAAAHWAALRGGGRTIAVLGSGVDVVYPSEHKALSRSIESQGAVVSELFMGTQPDAENFPHRNRIVSGLSLGTVVVEAADKSGSLITAMVAADQGREVFAVPGAVGERTRGTHRLVRQGAKLTESVEDIVEEIAPHLLKRKPTPGPVSLDDCETTIVRCLSHEPLHMDSIVERSGLPVAKVMETLLALELRGVIQQLPGACFVTNAVDVRESVAKK